MTPDQQLAEQTAQLAMFADRFEQLSRRLRAAELALASRGGWQPVSTGTASSASSIDIAVPASTFRAVRVTLTGLASGATNLLMTLNNETSSASYRTSRRVFAGTYSQTPGETGTASILGTWGTTEYQQLELTLERTDFSGLVSWRGFAYRRANNTTDSANVMTSFDGRVASNTLLSSIQLSAFGETISGRWRLEGFRA